MALASFRLPSVCTMNVLRAGPLVHRGDEQELLYLYATPREFIRCPAADQCDESRVRDREEGTQFLSVSLDSREDEPTLKSYKLYVVIQPQNAVTTPTDTGDWCWSTM